MNGVFYIGATGLHAQQRSLDMVANNIANINTPSFKRAEPRFAELVAGPVSGGSERYDQPAGVIATAASRSFEQGELRVTGKALDIAVEGSGFIELMASSGHTLLWRGGSLKTNADGLLATADGVPLKAMISIPEGVTGLVIGRDGTITGVASGDQEAKELGRIELVTPRNVDGLTALEGGVYAAADGEDVVAIDAGEQGAGAIIQGSIEASNANLSDEMVSLLVMQRAYAASAQLVQAGDQLMAIANGMKR